MHNFGITLIEPFYIPFLVILHEHLAIISPSDELNLRLKIHKRAYLKKIANYRDKYFAQFVRSKNWSNKR